MQSFNIASQGPFLIMIEDISSRNSLLPLSNVLLLRVTDLLQQEDCCCYKREDQLKKKDIQKSNTLYNQNSELSKQSQALTIAGCVKGCLWSWQGMVLDLLRWNSAWHDHPMFSFTPCHCSFSRWPATCSWQISKEVLVLHRNGKSIYGQNISL